MKKLLLTLAAISALFSALIAPAAWADTPKRGGTLIAAMGTNVRNLNPAVQSGIVTGFPGAQLFASPLRYDEDWTPQPYLARSWKVSDDGLKVTLNLVENAKFHDGKPVTSEDVAFSVAPVSRPEARELMKETKGIALLEGARGETAVDLEAVEDLICRVGRLVADFPDITEMDLNPIFTYPTGTPPAAVDVRIKIR